MQCSLINVFVLMDNFLIRKSLQRLFLFHHCRHHYKTYWWALNSKLHVDCMKLLLLATHRQTDHCNSLGLPTSIKYVTLFFMFWRPPHIVALPNAGLYTHLKLCSFWECPQNSHNHLKCVHLFYICCMSVLIIVHR